MPVNSTHPDYDVNLSAWTRARDVIAGEDAVKAGGEKYLPRLEAQPETEHFASRELGAKLASLKGTVWVGVAMFLFGIATLAYPPLRAIVGSVTTSIAIIIGGIALMVLPTLIFGNELLILGSVAALVGGWFFAHRHGELRDLSKSSY